MMTTVTPEGPKFFWAPAKMRPNLFTSTGRQAVSEDMSATNGTLCGSEPLSGPVSGIAVHCVPSIVLLVEMWTQEAARQNFISSRGGGRRHVSSPGGVA